MHPVRSTFPESVRWYKVLAKDVWWEEENQVEQCGLEKNYDVKIENMKYVW